MQACLDIISCSRDNLGVIFVDGLSERFRVLEMCLQLGEQGGNICDTVAEALTADCLWISRDTCCDRLRSVITDMVPLDAQHHQPV